MRILHLGKYYYPEVGGVETFTRDLAEEQARRGHEVCVLCHQHVAGRPSQDEIINNVRVRRSRLLGRLVYAPVAPFYSAQLTRELATFKPDVVHAHVPNTSAFWLLGRFSLPPVVLQWQSDVVPSAIDKRLAFFYAGYSLLERRLLRRSAAVIATSMEYLAHSKPLNRVWDKVRCIPLGLNPKRMHWPTEEKPPPLAERIAGRPLIMSMGRFTYYKGFEYLIRAMQQVLNAACVIVGDGDLHPRMEELVRSLRLEDRVFLPGRLSDEDAHALLDACTLFCLPSVERTEAFGLVLLEAMAFGKPVLTSRIEGSSVNVVNREDVTGMAVNPADPDDLARGLRRMLASPSLCSRMAANAREHFERRHHIRPVAGTIEKLYEELLRKQ